MLADPNDVIIQQLTRIANAVSKPAPSPWLDWLKMIASLVAGLGIAYLIQLLQGRTNDSREQRQMRRIVYRELAKGFLNIDFIMREYTGPDGNLILNRQRLRVFQNFCSFNGEAYMKGNTATFYQLGEGEILTSIYYWFHQIDGSSEAGGPVYGLAQMKAPLGFFSDCYRKYPDLKKYLKQFIQADDFRYIDEATRRYKRASTWEELEDAGMIEIVEKPEK